MSHRWALARLRLTCGELRICMDRTAEPVRPTRKTFAIHAGSVLIELHALTTHPAWLSLRRLPNNSARASLVGQHICKMPFVLAR